MSSRPEDVRLELKLKNCHVIDLFHALRCDGQFSLLIFSTRSLVKLMNKVFCLEHHHVVLEYKQLNDVLKSDANLRLILWETDKPAKPRMFFILSSMIRMAKGKHTTHFLIRQRTGSSFSLRGEKQGGQQGSAGMKHLIFF